MRTVRKRAAFTPARLQRALLESVSDLIFVMSPAGRYLFINQGALDCFGLHAQDITGRTPEEAFGPALGRVFSRNSRQVLESGKPLQLTEWLSLPSGMRSYSTLLTPVTDRRGRVEAILGIGRDVTDLRRLAEEQELRSKQMESLFQQRVRNETLVERVIKEAIGTSPLGDFFEAMLKLLGEGLGVSRSYLFEYDRVRRKASNTHEWAAPNVVPLKAMMQDVPVASQPWWTHELLAGRMIRLDDIAQAPSPELQALFAEQGVKACLAVPIFAFGSPYGFIGFDEDRRVRCWSETEVELLSGVARIIAQKVERSRLETDILVSERLAAIGQMTASFTHEINNPLQAIILHLEGLEGHVDGEGQRHLDRVTDGFRRVARIVTGLLNVNRPSMESTELLMNEVVRDAFALVGHQVDVKNISVRWHLEPELRRVLGDERKLQQVFLNVLLNAVDSMERNGELTIATSNEERDVRIDLQDTGCGIDEESLPYIFDPFFTTKEKNGTGLGLFVSHMIVREHGGKVEVRSVRGEGTTVSIFLPAAGTPAAAGSAASSTTSSRQEG